MQHVILAGFEPFGGRARNRSWEAIEQLPSRPGLERVRLRVVFEEVARVVPELVARRPDLLLLVGEDGRRRRGVAVERIALNTVHARIPDNAGRRPRAQKLVENAPLAYPATWDAPAVLDALGAAGLVAELSHHAGTYACNAAFYHALHAAAGLGHTAPIGFLHVPAARFPLGPRRPLLALALEVCILTTVSGRAI